MREEYVKPIMEIEPIDADIIMTSQGAGSCCDERCDSFG